MFVIAVVGLGAPVATWQQSTPPASQAPPATEVYLTDLGGFGIINISNSPGYDNQPSFLPDGKSILFASNRDGRQTDIYRYELASKSLTQLTRTAESEYSPLVAPDATSFSVVRVEADNTQRLWRFDLDGSNPRLVLTDVKPVGYHVWIDATHLGLFVLGGPGQPNTLQIADTASGKAEVIASTIGRGLFMRPGRKTLSFVSKQSTPWMIKELDPATRATTDVAPVVDGSEDYAWDPVSPDRVYMARGSKLFSFRNGVWAEVVDFSAGRVGNITRLAMGPRGSNQLAIVGEPIAR